MGKYAREAENTAKSCKSRGSHLRVHFKVHFQTFDLCVCVHLVGYVYVYRK